MLCRREGFVCSARCQVTGGVGAGGVLVCTGFWVTRGADIVLKGVKVGAPTRGAVLPTLGCDMCTPCASRGASIWPCTRGRCSTLRVPQARPTGV